MNDQKLKKLLDKYLSGNATKAETFIVESWLESFQYDKDEVAPFENEEYQDLLAEQIIAKTLNSTVVIPETRTNSFKLWKKISGVAAILTIISAITVYYAKNNFGGKATLLATNYLTYQTKVKEFKQLQLPDSTIVYLNANSTLEVQQNFTKLSERRVKLRGEAFFEVKKDKKHPFKIQVGELEVKVLGTSFNVKAAQATEEIIVAVKSGKVNVSTKNKLLSSLVADQKLTFDKTSKMFEVNDGKENARALWRDGVVVLEKASFAELSASIYNIYGVKLKSSDAAVLARTYNFTIRSSRTLLQTLNQLCEMIKKKHRKEGSSIVIF